MKPDFSKKNYHCWITNVTTCKIRLSDIGFCLNPYETVDILDYKHSPISIEQAEKSINSGSISSLLKSKKILIRQSEPQKIEKIIEVSNVNLLSTHKTLVELERKIYKELELDVSDDEFAMLNSDIIIEENKPRINLREKKEKDG